LFKIITDKAYKTLICTQWNASDSTFPMLAREENRTVPAGMRLAEDKWRPEDVNVVRVSHLQAGSFPSRSLE
jgi:hypothetical protein